MGVVSPVGLNVADFWSALLRGESGIRPLTRFPTTDYAFSAGGEVRGFALPPPLAAAGADADLATQFMLAAAAEALRQAGLPGTSDPAAGAVVVSTNFGGILAGERLLAHAHGKGPATGRDFAEYGFQTCADRVARAWALAGPRVSLSLSCASGTAALGHAFDLVRSGRAAFAFAGGYDALSPFVWSGLSALRTMAKDAVRPFDRNRAGTIFSEGAGALIVEDAGHARRRGARPLCEVLGYGVNNNAFHMTAPAKEGAGSAQVMRAALADAGLAPAAVDHINAHGTGTKPNDVTESQAIQAVFGEHAARIPITSIKSTVGHMMGAAGSVEAIASVLTLREGVIPPTTNFRERDPECALDYVFNEKRAAAVTTVLSNSAGIGGCNAAVILRRVEGAA
jgi:3-oxoacyl-(acyl-carrier-protein) synthase